MPRIQIHRIQVEFGDCAPAQIAFYPNFFRGSDAASRHFFEDCGVPLWREPEQTRGMIGTPVIEAGSRFILLASYGDVSEVYTAIEAWREKSVVTKYALQRGQSLLAEGRDVRIFAIRHPQDPARIRRFRRRTIPGNYAVDPHRIRVSIQTRCFIHTPRRQQ